MSRTVFVGFMLLLSAAGGVRAERASGRTIFRADTPSAATTSETWRELPAILLPETVIPERVTDRTGHLRQGEVVLSFILDTLGRVGSDPIATLTATGSTLAIAARRSLANVRYVPARLVRVGGPCIRVNGDSPQCYDVTPGAKRVRIRTVLRIEFSGGDQ